MTLAVPRARFRSTSRVPITRPTRLSRRSTTAAFANVGAIARTADRAPFATVNAARLGATATEIASGIDRETPRAMNRRLRRVRSDRRPSATASSPPVRAKREKRAPSSTSCWTNEYVTSGIAVHSTPSVPPCGEVRRLGSPSERVRVPLEPDPLPRVPPGRGEPRGGEEDTRPDREQGGPSEHVRDDAPQERGGRGRERERELDPGELRRAVPGLRLLRHEDVPREEEQRDVRAVQDREEEVEERSAEEREGGLHRGEAGEARDHRPRGREGAGARRREGAERRDEGRDP